MLACAARPVYFLCVLNMIKRVHQEHRNLSIKSAHLRFRLFDGWTHKTSRVCNQDRQDRVIIIIIIANLPLTPQSAYAISSTLLTIALICFFLIIINLNIT